MPATVQHAILIIALVPLFLSRSTNIGQLHGASNYKTVYTHKKKGGKYSKYFIGCHREIALALFAPGHSCHSQSHSLKRRLITTIVK